MRFKQSGYWNKARCRGRIDVTQGLRGGLNYTIDIGIDTLSEGHSWSTTEHDLIVDWGDGTVETINTVGDLSHDYLVAGIYQVHMESEADGFLEIDFNNQPDYLVSVDEPIEVRLMTDGNKHTILYRMFAYCELLTSIPSPLFDDDINAYSAYKMFQSNISLLSIDKDTFINCKQVSDLSYMFVDSGILTVPSDLLQPFIANVDSVNRMFDGSKITTAPANLFNNAVLEISWNLMFYNCDFLTTVSSDFFAGLTGQSDMNAVFRNCGALEAYPTGLFDGVCSSDVDFTYLFSNCTSMSNDADDLWNDYPLASVGNTFTGCINLTNYASIPIDWK